MEMDRMSSDLRLKKDVELSQAAYLKFRSVFNGSAGDPAQVYRDRGTGLVGISLRVGTNYSTNVLCRGLTLHSCPDLARPHWKVDPFISFFYFLLFEGKFHEGE